MNCLKQFWNIFREFFQNKLNVKLPAQVEGNEPIGRYLFRSSQFSRIKLRPNSSAFMPHPVTLELSVVRIVGIEDSDIRRISKKIIKRSKSLEKVYGLAEIEAGRVQKAGLSVLPDDKPFLRHANIVGWPKEKQEQKIFAAELAQNAKLKLFS